MLDQTCIGSFCRVQYLRVVGCMTASFTRCCQQKWLAADNAGVWVVATSTEATIHDQSPEADVKRLIHAALS